MLIKKAGVVALFVCTLLLLFSISALASNYSTELPKDMDQEYILEEIIKMANDFRDLHGREVTKEDVDLSKAYRIYISNDLFRLNTNRYDEIVKYLESGDMIYKVPVKLGEVTVVANIQRRNPIPDDVRHLFTAEEIAQHEERVGTWVVSAATAFMEGNPVNSPYVDYYETASRVSGRTDVQPILVGGLPGFNMPIAIYPDESGNAGQIVPTVPQAVSWGALRLDSKAYENKAISYTVAKESASRIKFSFDERAGGFGGVVADNTNGTLSERALYIVAISLLLLLSTVAIIIRRRRMYKDLSYRR